MTSMREDVHDEWGRKCFGAAVMSSPVWNYFDVSRNNEKFAICRLCSKEISRGGALSKTFNTTNLIRHLRTSHRESYGEYEKLATAKKATVTNNATLTQPSITDILKKHELYTPDSKKAKDITAKIMEFICIDHQPLSVTEDIGFKRLIAHLEPRYKLPRRKYFTDVALPELYQIVYSHINSLLHENLTAVSLTTDIWSSSVSPMSMLSLTAQWITEDFEKRQVILHSQEFPGSHTAEALVAKYKDMLQAWNIPEEKVHVVLRDNAKNIAKAMRDCNLRSVPCMAHTLHLVVHEGVLSQRAIRDAVAICRRIVGHFKHSPQAYSRLGAIQKQLGQSPKRLQQDVDTRWNSTYYMLNSLLEHKHALIAYTADYDIPNLNATQWKLIENMVSILQPFEELTKEISSLKSSVADVIPSVSALKRLLERESDSDHGVKTSKQTLLEAVVRRFSNIDKEPVYVVATVLDPR